MDWIFSYVQVGNTLMNTINVGVLSVQYYFPQLLVLVVCFSFYLKGCSYLRSEPCETWYCYFVAERSAGLAFPLWAFCLLKREAKSSHVYFCHINFVWNRVLLNCFSSRVLLPLVSYLSPCSGSFCGCWIQVRHWRLSMIWVRMAFLQLCQVKGLL